MIMQNPDSGLDLAQLESLAAALERKREQLQTRVLELQAQLLEKDDCSLTDAIDAAGRQEGRHRASGLLEQHSQLIAEVDAALLRLSKGSYGVDADSNEPIGYERLLIVPWARSSGDRGAG